MSEQEVIGVSGCERNANALRHLERFFIIEKNEDGEKMWFHKRVEEELSNAKAKSEKAQESANSRWKGKKKGDNNDANAMRTHCEGNASHNHNQNHNHLKNIYKKDLEEKDFEERRVSEVFGHWVSKAPDRHLAILDKSRIRAISKMLEYFSVDNLKLAIDGCSLDPYFMGENKSGAMLDSVEIIFKNVTNVGKFIEIAKNPPSLSPESKPENDKYEFFMSETKDDNAAKFVEILKRAESENRYNLTLDEVRMYHKNLKSFSLSAISGACDDFQTRRTPYDGRFPKAPLLIDFARQREKAAKMIAESEWGHLLRWIEKKWNISDMEPCKTRVIMIENEEFRGLLPDKLEDFAFNEKAKEKFIELFLKIEEGK